LNELASRFEIIEGGLGRDNRITSAFDHLYKSFLTSDRLILLILSWIMRGTLVAKKDKDCILLLLLFLLNMYQRVYLLSNMYGYVVLLGGMEWIHEKKGDIKIG